MISSKRKIQIMLLLFLLGFLALVFWAIVPLIGGIRKQSHSLGSQKAVLELVESQIANLESFQKNYSAYEKTLQELEDSFLNFAAPVDFFIFLEQQAKESGVEIDASPLPASGTEKQLQINFQVLVAGAFSDCLKFLRQIEYSPFLLEVNELVIDRIKEKDARFKQFENLVPGNVVFIINLKALAKEKNVND